MADKVTYLVDTCALVNIRDIHSDSEELWAKVIEGINNGTVKTVRHVMDELHTKWPDIYKRLQPYKKKFIVPNAKLYSEDVKNEIAEVRKHHPGLYNPEGGGNPADPFLIGCAKALDGIVVTDERAAGKKHKEKIPYVCKSRNVGSATRLEFLKAIGVVI